MDWWTVKMGWFQKQVPIYIGADCDGREMPYGESGKRWLRKKEGFILSCLAATETFFFFRGRCGRSGVSELPSCRVSPCQIHMHHSHFLQLQPPLTHFLNSFIAPSFSNFLPFLPWVCQGWVEQVFQFPLTSKLKLDFWLWQLTCRWLSMEWPNLIEN